MLTKDQLKYTVRADKIFPKYVKPSDAEANQYAQYLVETFSHARGQKQHSLNEKIKEHPKSSSILFAGLSKLLEDRCEYLESEDAVEQYRWAAFSKAKAIRNSGLMTIREYQAGLMDAMSQDFPSIENRLYSDLPEFRIIEKFDPIDPIDLIHRYNASQIQGLILRSRSLTLTVNDKDPIKRRRFLQRLKFWRLLAEVQESKDGLLIDLSGPLAIFDKSATYGGRLSNFFPNILLMDKWSIVADIKIDEKTLTLELDSSKPIKSHYGYLKGYIPPEFKEFIKIFNEIPVLQRHGFEAMEGDDILNLGGQNYSVPDISFQNAEGKRIHLELFHKWHEAQLKQRVDALMKARSVSLILGVAGELLPKEKVKEMNNSSNPALSIFSFKQFPTPKAIMAYLS
jgi:predicted nuclease of restriction endonuclease-like RecB superfamily